MKRLVTPALALLLALAAFNACSSTGAARAPAIHLVVTGTEAFPGSYGDVGEYEKLTGTLRG